VALAWLAACGAGPDRSAPEAPAALAGSTSQAAPPTPVDSRLALFSNGGGCYPPGIATDPRSPAALTLVNPEWAPVVNGSSPLSAPVLLHGTAIASRVSRDDFPAGHVRYDQNTDLLLDPADAGLLATGNVFGPESEPVPHLEMEWETGSFPDWAWPGEGDRVVALGRWIFDCGHPDPVPGICRGAANFCLLDGDCGAGGLCDGTVWNFRSELHPPQAVAVIRQGRGALLGRESGEDEEAVPATRADVIVSPDGGAAADACVVSHKRSIEEVIGAPCFPLQSPLALFPPDAPPLNSRDFSFDVPLPAGPRGHGAIWRVLQRPTPNLLGPPVPARFDVEPSLRGPHPRLRVTVRMTEPVNGRLPTGFAATLFAGWRQARTHDLEHLRVTVEGVVVRDARKPFALAPPLDPPPGWRMQAAVNGEWQELPGLGDVARGAEGRFFATPVAFDQYLPRHGALRLFAGGSSAACVETMFAQSLLETIIRFGGSQDLAGACLFTTDPGLGQVNLTIAGPHFGARPAAYEVTSESGSCSATATLDCRTNGDCPAGETCEGIGAFALRFRIEKVEDD
jgi:hypothetical protein